MPKPQSRKEHFAEGSGVKHASRAIQALESWRGETAMMELAVVVILDDPSALAIGPVEQSKSSFDREGHAQRILMRRCHKRERGVRRTTGRRSDIETAIVDSDAYESELGLQH